MRPAGTRRFAARGTPDALVPAVTSPIRVGDVVRPRSGGRRMCVVDIDVLGVASLEWWLGMKEQRRVAKMHTRALRRCWLGLF